MIKDVDDLPISKVFDPEAPSFYVVPKYQREYVWGVGDWEALIDDLIENESHDGHFLGTFLSVNRESGSHKVPRYDVIDGQQRLTTLSLLLAAIYQVLSADQEKTDEKIVELVLLRKMLVIEGEPRLLPQESGENRNDFLAVLQKAGLGIKAKDPKWMGLRRIDKGYRYFTKRIAEIAAMNEVDELTAARDLLRRVKEAVLVKLEVATFSDAFKLFESLNNRGKPLTPIDLIKNSLLAKADTSAGISLDSAYEDWKLWLDRLGDDYATQERFFRYFYNAMKDVWGLAIPGAPVATKSNLIKIYEEQIDQNLVRSPNRESSTSGPPLLEGLDLATEAYEQLIAPTDDSWDVPDLSRALADLVRAEGTTAHVLLLYLLLTRGERDLSDAELTDIVRLLTSFSVRRNMTNQPPTYALQRVFMEIISEIEHVAARGRAVRLIIMEKLRDRSADDDQFLQSLSGRIYEEHTNVARFVLIHLARSGMTKESWQDLWARDQNRSGDSSYRWTIEHILPQSDVMVPAWVQMLGGVDEAKDTQAALVHHLGNLTITGYNSALGKKSFLDKRDRRDDSGKFIGYRNGLNLNSDLATRDDWGREAILQRTNSLAQQVVDSFPLA
jgi:hypothetical protein